MRAFLLVWLGSVGSTLGSGLTTFALGVWVYERTGSPTQFAFLTFCAMFPMIVLSPVAGVAADRYDRRKLLIVSDALAALSTLGLLLLLWTGRLEIAWVFALTAASSAFTAAQLPALNASVPLLVPKRHLGRAAGLMDLGVAASLVVSPLLAGILLTAIDLTGIFAVDFLTFAFSMGLLVFVVIPKPERSAEGRSHGDSFWTQALAGWTAIRNRPGLPALLGTFAGLNFSVGILQALLTPMVLSFASVETLGTVLSIASCGALTGGLIMSLWGGPRQRIRGIFGFALLQGSILFLSGLEPSAPLIAAAAFGFLFCFPMINGSSTALWQSKVPPDLQGRVFAFRRLAGSSSQPLGILVGGPLAEYVFEPLMVPGGPLADTVGGVIGVGPGRGIALLFMTLGALIMVMLATAFANPRLRRLEVELPDALPDAA